MQSLVVVLSTHKIYPNIEDCFWDFHIQIYPYHDHYFCALPWQLFLGIFFFTQRTCPSKSQVFAGNFTHTVCPYLDDYFRWISRVWSDNEGPRITPFLDDLFQLLAPHVLTGIPQVIAVAHHSNQPCGELGQHVLEGFILSILAPCCDGAATENQQTNIITMFLKALYSLSWPHAVMVLQHKTNWQIRSPCSWRLCTLYTDPIFMKVLQQETKDKYKTLNKRQIQNTSR